MGPTKGSFKPGDPRINRNGRPRAGTAFSERGRERLDPDKVLDLVERTLADETLPPRERLAIVMPVVDRVYAKPITATDVTVRTDEQRLSDAVLARLSQSALDELEAAQAAAGQQPDGVTVEDQSEDVAPRPERAP